ncbi:MAG: putative Zn-dependent protease [Myxococcota bacterium]|jgi:predicted Zn-dependent protease
MLLLATLGCANFNLFPLRHDIKLGQQVHEAIVEDGRSFGLVERDQNPEVYVELDRVFDRVLDSGNVSHVDTFPWQVWLLHDDATANAFALPGGYVYVYTGLIRELESEDALAGIVGHEIAHAAARHSTEQLSRRYGVDALLALATGGGSLAIDIAAGLTELDFNRGQESESDGASVRYLCNTVYAADGAAYFFDGIDGKRVPAFLSTHPDPGDRTDAIRDLADYEGCSTRLTDKERWGTLLDALP